MASGKLRGADHRLLRGYAPLVGIVAALLLVALLVPTVQPEQNVAANGPGSNTAGVTGDAGGATGTLQGSTGGAAGTAGTSGGSGAGGSTGNAGGVVGGHITGPPPGATSCTGLQVPGDSYSPPCVQWAGGTNNFGATSAGVTADAITVTLRETDVPDVGALVAQFTGGKVQIHETPADVERTYHVLADYFNKHFQFYGRKIQIKVFHGQGSLTTEALGGGQDTAQADAINAAQQQHAFADISSLTQPYSEALVARKVVSLNNLYFSQQWYAQRAPYAWSFVPDGTKVVQAGADFTTKYLVGKPASYAGGSLQGKPRKIAVIAPDNPIYQQSVSEFVNRVGRSNIADVRSYPLDIGSLQTNANNLVNVLSGEGITTVLVATDPVTPFFMSAAAAQSGWTPEWVLAGVAFTDADFVGQLMNQQEWSHSFGVSYLAAQQPERASAAYRAYKEMSPGTEPAQLLVAIIYYELEMLAIGVQGAGPSLTPATLQDGFARYPGGSGEAGSWAFPRGQYTPEQDGRIVWWDPHATSQYNGQLGAYRDNGKRYPLGGYPAGAIPVFPSGAP
jgi:hypothetical protein